MASRRGVRGKQAEDSPWENGEKSAVWDVIVREAMYGEQSGH